MGLSPLRYRVALVALVLLLLATGASAIERPFIYQGTVEGVDTGSRNVTVTPSAEFAGGAWTGATHRHLSGVAPAGADLAALAPGTLVEAASLGTPGGRWTMLAPLAPSSPSFQPPTRATAVFGDPAFLVSRLPGEVQVQYTISGLCGPPGSPGAATAASITFSVERGEDAESRTLDLPAGGEGNATLNGTALRVRFNGGEVSQSPACPATGAQQPVADFSIVASGGPPSPPSDAGASPGSGEKTPGFSAFLGLAALGAAAVVAHRR